MRAARKWMTLTGVAVAGMCFAVSVDAADVVVVHHHHYRSSRALASNVVVPQLHVFVSSERPAVRITGVDAVVGVVEQVATTTMDIALENPTGSIIAGRGALRSHTA